MSFSEFKTESHFLKKYGIRYQVERFIESQPLAPPDDLVEDLEYNRKYYDIFGSEAARLELVIFPILREVNKPFVEEYALWVQEQISYSTELNGTPDYILATRSELGIKVMGSPLVLIVEAKKNDFEHGWGQCLAAMYTAQKINEDDAQTLYGIVTDGNLWQFGKLTANEFTKNKADFSLSDLPGLFGAARFVFAAACGELQKVAAS